MQLDDVERYVVSPGLSLLPERMDSKPARAMLYAIGLQESRFEYREQIHGPANGYWQFERDGGVAGVLRHAATRVLARGLLQRFDYDPEDLDDIHEGLEHNPVVACALARLLLWTEPRGLPSQGDYQLAWEQYLNTWRPGKPHGQTWSGFYKMAWDLIL